MREDILKDRIEKKNRLSEAGFSPYPARVKRSHIIREILENFGKLEKGRKKVTITGRVTGMRRQGALIFLDVLDSSARLQAVVKKENVKNFALLDETLDIGDFVECAGPVFKTKRGEKSVLAKSLAIIAKSLRPIPTEFYGLKDVETRLRKRYLDLLLDPSLREMFRRKNIFWQSLRRELSEEDFLEVETPVLESVPGGAEAEPFKTRHNALDEEMYLRISLELPLKKLMVAGFERVFEIGRVFRNEGLSPEHLQDYTALEMYSAYEDYKSLMKFLEKVLKRVIKETTGTLTTSYRGEKVQWGKKWRTYDYYELFKKHTGIDLSKASRGELLAAAKKMELENLFPEMGRGKVIDLIFKKRVRLHIKEPGFLIDPPVDIEPLAKRSEKDPNRVERFQIVACGTELGKGFSELNDPMDQRKRFEEQMALREKGDKEAQRLNEEYLEAMEYGMPPNAGFGLSERFFATLMDKPVRETVIFPLMRTKE